MTRPSSAILRTAVGVAVASLALSACGSNSLSSGGSTSSGPAPTATKNADLAAKLPAKIKSSGEIVVGTDATYAPNEFLATDGKTVQGMDVDLFNTVAQEFGVKVKFVPANFDSIILGVDSGKYDMGISSFSITDERKKQVNIIVEVGQDKVTADVTSGKADAMLADSPVGLYAVKQTGGQLEPVGSIYDSAPYGYVIPKSETEFGNALVDALKQLESSGAYKQALAKWGIQTGAINNFALNP